ncbi:agenet domain-containing protein [Spirochaeta lutea]|uniref:agenet domain-containing protein n=1 Tax=Spirochaeta lutea TaxID=1480694 RepID=UPI0009DDEC0D|nr:agenet domain-containing protein [Spirochaeta lutea]
MNTAEIPNRKRPSLRVPAVILMVLVLPVWGFSFETGDEVEIEYYGSWFAGEIIQSKEERYLVRYHGWDSSYDEWVSRNRLRYPKAAEPEPEPVQPPRASIPEPPAIRPRDHYPVSAGDRVELRRNFYWYEVEVVKIEGDRILIHYPMYDDQSNEWVSASDIRTLAQGRDWEDLMHRFWYDLSPEAISSYLGLDAARAETPARAGEQVFPSPLVIYKREQPYAEISPQGSIRIGSELVGSIRRDFPGFRVYRGTESPGRVDSAGSIFQGERLLGSVSETGTIADSQGREIGSISPDTGVIYFDGWSEWGWVSTEDHGVQAWGIQAIGGFLFFFTELPHAMTQFSQYE